MAKKAEKAEKGTFQVVIDVDLPSAARQNIARAIQKAVLNELANIDVADGYSVSLRKEDIAKAIGGGGQTDGIHIREQ